MNDRERVICARLRQFRVSTGFVQTDFAKALGITRSQLSGAEYEGNPIRYWLADRVCQKFGICQQWLATGDQPVRGYVELPGEIGIEIGLRELFSAAWDRRVGHMVKRAVKEAAAIVRGIEASKSKGISEAKSSEAMRIGLQQSIDAWFSKIAADRHGEFLGWMQMNAAGFIQGKILGETPVLSAEGEKYLLTGDDLSVSVGSVKSPLANLIKRLNKATTAYGAKAELARTLEIAPETLIRYLSGTMEPGGEIALRLLQWVEQQERK